MVYGPLETRFDNLVRVVELVRVMVHHGFAHLVRGAGLHEGLPARVLRELRLIETPSGEPETAGRRLRRAFSELGPTFVKLGQVLATRPDLLGKDVCDELSNLQDRVAPVPWSEVEPLLVDELEGPVDDLFRSFDRDPVAAASVSQVYRATLRDGTEVAVKVRRPGIQRVVDSDLRLLANLAEWMVRDKREIHFANPVATVEELTRSIRRELDLSVERRTIERFRAAFEGEPRVFIPRTYPELCTRTVLTLDWIDGVRIDAVEAFPGRNSDPATVARLGCEVVAQQVFDHRLFHADPHPGNVFLLRDNRIAFLDYGMVGRLAQPDVLALADLLLAFYQGDPEACVRQLLTFTTGRELEDRRALIHDVADFLAFEAQEVVGGAQVGRAIEYLTELLRRHRLELAPRFSLLLKAFASIESTAHALAPDLDLLPVLRPHIERIVKKRYSPREIVGDVNQELQAVLRVARDLPDDLQGLLRKTARGRLRVILEHDRIEQVIGVIDRGSNRIAFGLVSGALIIGSSLLMTTEKAAPNLGLAGFVVAGLLGFGLLISILRSRDY